MEELLAKLRELQKQQQQLNEQMAEAQQSAASQSQAGTQQGNRSDQDGEPVAQQSDGQQSDPSADSEQAEGGQDDDQLADQNGSRQDSLSEDQEQLGQRTGNAASEVAEMPIDADKSSGKSKVASELRRASEYQSKAAQAIAANSLGDAQQSGSEGAASIAEAIAQLEDLVFAEVGGRNEADSFPPGYENLIQEYLRAISYE